MTNPNDPAFPPDLKHLPDGPVLDFIASQRGLTKREWFAGMAMQGICANAYMSEKMESMTLTVKDVALFAISQADAFIAELNK